MVTLNMYAFFYTFLIYSSPAQMLYHQEQIVGQGELHYFHIPSHHTQYKSCWLLLGSHILIYNSSTWDDSVDTAEVSPYGIFYRLQSTETVYHTTALNVPQYTQRQEYHGPSSSDWHYM
jgi:hypothetical protein